VKLNAVTSGGRSILILMVRGDATYNLIGILERLTDPERKLAGAGDRGGKRR
jgi:hypothetical protein